MYLKTSLHSYLFLSQYNISATTYFTNYLQSVQLSFMDGLTSLRQPVDKSVWLNAPTAVNAYYDPQFNQFGKLVQSRGSFAYFHAMLLNIAVFLEGILNVPFFDAGWPE